MVQDIANVNGVKTFVSEVKFQKITSGSLFLGRNDFIVDTRLKNMLSILSYVKNNLI